MPHATNTKLQLGELFKLINWLNLLYRYSEGFKNKSINQKAKKFTFEDIKMLTNIKNTWKMWKIWVVLDDEHALKNPLDNVIDKIIEIFDKNNQDDTEMITDDMPIINRILSFRSNLVPVLSRDHFKKKIAEKAQFLQRVSRHSETKSVKNVKLEK